MFNCASLTSHNAAAATLDEVGKSVQKETEVIQECINKNHTEHPVVIKETLEAYLKLSPEQREQAASIQKLRCSGHCVLPKPDHWR